MKALTILMYLAIAAIVVTVVLTATSGGMIDWDESMVALVPLTLLAGVLSYLRRRRVRPPVA